MIEYKLENEMNPFLGKWLLATVFDHSMEILRLWQKELYFSARVTALASASLKTFHKAYATQQPDVECALGNAGEGHLSWEGRSV